MDIITLTKENLKTEHIFCAISRNDDYQVEAKKRWLADQLNDWLVFLK